MNNKDFSKLPEEMTMLSRYIPVQIELQIAIEKYPNFPDDMFRQLAIMQEEAGEVTKAVLDYHDGKATLDNILIELTQTAAMCIRMIEALPINKHVKTLDDKVLEACQKLYNHATFETPMSKIAEDSLDFVELIMRCESELKVSISDDATDQIFKSKPETVSDFIQAIKPHLNFKP